MLFIMHILKLDSMPSYDGKLVAIVGDLWLVRSEIYAAEKIGKLLSRSRSDAHRVFLKSTSLYFGSVCVPEQETG